MNAIRYRVRVTLLIVLLTLTMGISIAQDSTSCEPSFINQQIDIAIADYQKTRSTDDLISALEDLYSLVQSSIGIFSECIPGLEALDNSTESNLDSSEGSPGAIRDEGGAGTFADPMKPGWIRGDGEGRWIGPTGYAPLGSEICTASGGYCKDIKPGNEFIGVAVYGKCDTGRTTRCNFSRYSEFELAGRRGIPYQPETNGIFEDYWTVFSEDILPGGESEGLVFFQAPKTESGFIFGWTPNYSSDTIWYGPLSDLTEPRQTTTTPESAPDRAFAQSNSLNIRSGPGTNYERVGSLSFGERVSVIGRNNSGTWIQTDIGWVSAQYLSWPSATDFMTLTVTSN